MCVSVDRGNGGGRCELHLDVSLYSWVSGGEESRMRERNRNEMETSVARDLFTHTHVCVCAYDAHTYIYGC